MHFTDATPVRLLPDVVSRVVSGEVLIVDLKSGHYFGLDVVLPDLGTPTKAALERAMEGHVLGKAEIVGTYRKAGR